MSDGFVKVTSSNIEAVSHKDGALLVRFKGGNVYRYADVPISHMKKMIKAKSPGSYFAANVRGAFEASRVEEKK